MQSLHCSRQQGSVRHDVERRVSLCPLLFWWVLLLGSMFGSPLQAQTRQARPDIAWAHGWNSTQSPGQIAFSADGTLVALTIGSTIKLITTAGCYLITTFPSRNSSISSLAFSPDGATLVDVGTKGIELWDTQNLTLLRTLDTNSWLAVAFSPDGKTVATENSLNLGSKIVLWSVASGAQLLSFTNPYPYPYPYPVIPLAYTPDGTGLAMAGSPSSICSTTDGSLVQTFAGTTSVSVAVSPNGKFFGTVDINSEGVQSATLWSIGSGPHYTLNTIANLGGALAFTPDSSELIFGGILGTNTTIWSTSSGTEVGIMLDSNGIVGIGFAKGVIYTIDPYLLEVWSSTTFALTTTEPAQHYAGIGAIAISPDGTTVATGSGDYSVKLWSASDGTLLQTFVGVAAGTGLAFSADSKTLISADNEGNGANVRVWNVANGTLIRSFVASGSTGSMALSPDGVTIALSAGSNTIQLWNYISGKLTTTLTGHSAAVNSVAFSPDGKTLASGSSDDTIKLWNLTSGTIITTLSGHAKAVNSVAFSPDGTQLLSGSSDTTAILWNVASGLQQASFPHSSPVNTVSFAPNGATFLTGTNSNSSTGTNQIKLWNLTNKTLIQNYTQEMGTGVNASTFSPNSQQFLYSHDSAFVLANVPTAPLLAFDFDGDGHNDLVLQNSQTGQIAIWNMNGTSVLGGTLLSTVPIAGWNVVGVGDFNRDGFPDLVLQNATFGQVVIWDMNNTAYLGGQATSFAPGSTYKVVAVGDFNGDGNPDLVFQDSVTNKIVIWYMNGPNVIGGVSVPYIPAANYHIVGTGDFNGDGQTDLLFQNSSTGQLVVWYMNGANYVGGAAITTIPGSGWVAKGVADYNNDGMPDIVFQNTTTNQVIVWYMNGLVFTGGSLTSYLPAANYRIAGPH